MRDLIADPIDRRHLLDKSDFPNNVIEQRAIKDLVIFRGNIADRPSNGSTEKQVYFAEDESKLYIWNTVNEAWEGVTLS